MPNLGQIASAGRLPGFGGGATASQLGLGQAPYLAAPQVSMSNPVGAPSQGLFDRVRYNLAGMSPEEKMKLFGGMGRLPGLGEFQGRGFDEIAPMLQRLQSAGLAGPGAGGGPPIGGGAGGAPFGQGPFPAPPMAFTQPPTGPRSFPTPPVTPGNATAPQLISRLGNSAAQIRNRLGGF